MLAEMFIVKLEAAARSCMPQQPLPSSNSQFVPFTSGNQFAFKGSVEPAVEVEKASAKRA